MVVGRNELRKFTTFGRLNDRLSCVPDTLKADFQGVMLAELSAYGAQNKYCVPRFFCLSTFALVRLRECISLSAG